MLPIGSVNMTGVSNATGKLIPWGPNGLAFRAFYALPEELQTVDGQPTNALLGTANMLMKLLMDYRPQVVLVAWDERPSGRAGS